MISALIASVVVSSNAVTFTAKATGVAADAPVEFLFAGPKSDRDYESLFLTDDPVAEIVTALERAGIPRGRGYDPRNCVFWPTGGILAFEPALSTLLRTTEGFKLTDPVFCGGDGTTDMPQALFALYNLAQSPVQMDETFDQGVAYNHYFPAKAWKKGDAISITVSWNGCETHDMTPDFPADKTVAEAVKVAAALAKVDSSKSKINGFRNGQFYYQAFLPKEQWRDRRERLVQPVEVHLNATNETYVVIDEDWSGPGNDPALSVREVSLAVARTNQADAVFFYAPSTTKLKRLYSLKAKFPSDKRTIYVFVTE